MRQARLLLADSHTIMLEALRRLLEPKFEIVGIADDTKSLFEAVDKLKPNIAVVDLSLPVANKGNIARQLKDRNPELKLIVLSVHDEPAVVNEAMAAGALGFVLLRSAAWDLIPAIREVLEGRTYVSPALGGKVW